MADVGLRDILANFTGVYEDGRVQPQDDVIAPQMIVVNAGLQVYQRPSADA